MVPSQRCQAEGIKSAGTAKEMPVSDKACKSQDFCASLNTPLMLFMAPSENKKPTNISLSL